jgi:hypothetical protein
MGYQQEYCLRLPDKDCYVGISGEEEDANHFVQYANPLELEICGICISLSVFSYSILVSVDILLDIKWNIGQMLTDEILLSIFILFLSK